MNNKIIPLILAGTTLLAGCIEEKDKNASAGSAAPTITREEAVAIVNGKYISKNALEGLKKEIAQRSHGQTFPEDQLVEELIQRELLVQDAIQKQLDKSPEFTERMETMRASLLSRSALEDYLAANPVTDEEIKAEYDAKMGSSGTEYKARHILVKAEDEAKQLIGQLKKGADFAELAKKKSTGPSGPKGGDLGWFTPDRMVPPFSEAVIAMENGQYSTEPVKTQFGWHVILREDSRAQTPPPLEAVKEQIRPMLQRKKIQTLLENMRKQAKVEILLTKTEPKTPETSPVESQPSDESVEVEESTEEETEVEESTEEETPEAPSEESENNHE